MPCRPFIDGVRPPCGVLSQVRCPAQTPDLFHQVFRVVGLVSANQRARLARLLSGVEIQRDGRDNRGVWRETRALPGFLTGRPKTLKIR